MAPTQLFPRIVAAEQDGRTHSVRYRQYEFHRLHSALVRHASELKDAIVTDSGHTEEEALAEIYLTVKEIGQHYSSLDLAEDLEAEYRIAKGKDNVDRTTGAGIVYIVPTHHTPLYSVIAPLSSAIAAGNCVIVELPRNTKTVTSLLRRLLPETMDADTFAISEKTPDADFLSKTVQVLQQPSEPSLSRRLVSPATSRTVAVVDRTASVKEAASSLVSARFAFGGKSPYSPDVVLVHEYILEPFLDAVLQQSSRFLAQQSGTPGTRAQDVQISSMQSLLDRVKKEGGTRVVVSGANGGVVEVQDRKSFLLQEKIEQRLLSVHAVTSLDDAIELSNTSGTLAATYAFAAPDAAKYLTQFIDSHVSLVNHVPYELLVGPAVPVNTPVNLQTRYPKDLFTVPRPQLITPTTKSRVLGALLHRRDAKRAAEVWNQTLAPLPPTMQKPGHKIGFFEQGIITGGVLTLLTLVATASTIGYYGFSFVQRWRK